MKLLFFFSSTHTYSLHYGLNLAVHETRPKFFKPGLKFIESNGTTIVSIHHFEHLLQSGNFFFGKCLRYYLECTIIDKDVSIAHVDVVPHITKSSAIFVQEDIRWFLGENIKNTSNLLLIYKLKHIIFYFMGSLVNTQQVRGIFHRFNHIFNRLKEHTSHQTNIAFTIRLYNIFSL